MKKTILILTALFITASSVFAGDTLPVTFKKQMNNMLTQYLDLKNALLKNDLKLANAEGKELLDAASAIKTDSLSKDQLAQFSKFIGKVKMNSEHISDAPAMEHVMEHFDYLSEAVYHLMKYFKAANTTLYYDFCPMANGDDGAHWITDKKEMSNPYLKGKVMGCEKQEEIF